jgi:hypothetical protein
MCFFNLAEQACLINCAMVNFENADVQEVFSQKLTQFSEGNSVLGVCTYNREVFFKRYMCFFSLAE